MSTELSNLLLVIIGALGLVCSIFASAIKRGVSQMSWRSIVVAAIGIAGSVALVVGVIRIMSEPKITPQNVEGYVRQWLDAFSLKTKKITDNPKVIFGYSVDFSDGQMVGVSRTKAFERFLTFEITVELSEELQAMFDNLPEKEKVSFLKELKLEILRSRVRGGMDAPFKRVVIVRLLPITSNLNEATVVDAIDEVHNCGLLIEAVITEGMKARFDKKEVKRL